MARTLLISLVVFALSGCMTMTSQQKPEDVLVGINYFAGWWVPLPNKWHNREGVDWRTLAPGRVPVLGEYNTQEVMDREIEAAADHGVDFFQILWYYGEEGAAREQHALLLNRGVSNFIASPNADRMRFYIEYCNHPPYLTSSEEWENCIRWWMPAFRHGSYLRAGGRLVLKVHSWHHFYLECGSDMNACHARLARLREAVREAGLGDMVIGCGVANLEAIPAGHPVVGMFDFTCTYMDVPPMETLPTDYPYEDLTLFIDEGRAIHSSDAIRYLPFLAAGWNPRPWGDPRACFALPTRPQWTLELTKMRADLDRYETFGIPLPGGGRQKAFTIYAWNEFGEGGFVAPTKGEGYMKLEAIAEVFGR